jgi:hypothetical protein
LFIVDDDILMIAHLVVSIDHETLRRMEALWHVTVQKLPYLVLSLTALLPGMRDCLAYVFEIIVKLFGSLEISPAIVLFSVMVLTRQHTRATAYGPQPLAHFYAFTILALRS